MFEDIIVAFGSSTRGPRAVCLLPQRRKVHRKEHRMIELKIPTSRLSDYRGYDKLLDRAQRSRLEACSSNTRDNLWDRHPACHQNRCDAAAVSTESNRIETRLAQSFIAMTFVVAGTAKSWSWRQVTDSPQGPRRSVSRQPLLQDLLISRWGCRISTVSSRRV